VWGAHHCSSLPVLALLAVTLSVAVVVVVVLAVVVVVATLSLAAVEEEEEEVVVVVVVVVAGSWWLRLKVVLVVDRCDAVRSHWSELEISLNSDCNFECIPVSSLNCLKSRKYSYTLP
jgi:hypothetical protein